MASQVLVEQLALFQQQRVDDLQLAYKLATDAYATRTLPAFDEIPSHVLLTVAATLMLAQLLLLMLTRSGRKLVIETLDTMAATVLIILLVGIVLGLPVGAAYLFFRGALFVGSALLAAFPQLRELTDSLMSTQRS